LSDSKRTGSRDISDLKARLGLKKGAQAPATGQTGSTRATNGVVAPPGLNLPPPPGMAPPQPTGPVIPNAADDPFGAMNAMAAVGTVQRAPEIVIVNDGKPVENVGKASMGATIAKVAVPAVITLVIGVAIGKIGSKASVHNAGIEDAKQLLGDKGASQSILGLKQTLSQIDTLLDEHRTKNQFRPDKKFDDDLKKLAGKLEVKEKSVLTRAKALDPDAAGSVHAFYAGVSEVKSMIDTHIKAASADNNAFTRNKEKVDAATLKDTENAPLQGQLRFAILIQAPTEQDKGVEFGAKVVEIGGVYCGTGDKPVAKCPEGESPTAVAYRSEVGAPILTKGDIQTPTTDAIPAKKIVQLIGGSTSIRDTLIKGADGVASEVYYQRRLRLLYETLRGKPGADGKPSGGLIDAGNDLERKMATEANKGTKFTWFM
jgi:hypothetical protein